MAIKREVPKYKGNLGKEKRTKDVCIKFHAVWHLNILATHQGYHVDSSQV